MSEEGKIECGGVTFTDARPEPPTRRELLSEDKKWRMAIDSNSAPCVRFGFYAEKTPILCGNGYGETRLEAMQNSRASLEKTIALYSELLREINGMIAAEEASNEVD